MACCYDMKTWTPLWSSAVNSSLWDEPDSVLKVFLTMLALKDWDHVYRGDAYGLGKQSRKTELEVLEALRVLASPDTKRAVDQPFEGRRIQAVEEGWLILNGEKYRSQVSLEMKRRRNQRAQAAYRARQKMVGSGREQRYVKAAGDGDQVRADQIAAEGLP